ncbi:MAG: class I SAM-dependent methyltransferase [Terriglobia bacterium]
MRMTALEKYFVNRPSHTRTVATHAQQLLDRAGRHAGWRYLDVGCGVGAAAREIAGTTKLEVTGIDIDPKQIETARNGPARTNLEFRVMDATRLDFRDGEFDIVAASMVTHHIPNWERALSEMVRVLRTGGYLIFSDFVFRSWFAKIGQRLLRFAGFPSTSALDSLATKTRLVKVRQLQQSGKVDVVWLKQA